MLLQVLSVAALTLLSHPADAARPPSLFKAAIQRKNIRNISATELQGLRDAVAAMKALPSSDPRSWQAQAVIHNNYCPHASSGGTLDFLPWHRKYLYYFEKILVSLSGGKLKSLPYWDYTNPAEAAIPPEFASPTYGASIPNPLYHANRSATYSSGVTPLPSNLMAPTNAMTALAFDNFCASLESTPHNNVHIQISGTMGTFMSPLDPIFWVHHCNIDRLWEQWLGMGGGRANRSDAAWLAANWNNTSFVDELQSPHQLPNSAVLNTVSQLNYTYKGLLFLPDKYKYLWKYLFKWQLLKPLPFDFVVGPRVVVLPDSPDIRMKQMSKLTQLDMKTVNAVIVFEVEQGNSSAGTFDLLIGDAKGTKSMVVTTFSLFALRHGGGAEHMHGMKENERPSVRLVLSPEETKRLLPVLKNKDTAFIVQLSKGSANNAKIAYDARIRMNLVAIEFMQTVKVKK